MHLQQTKRASIESGEPQYYFHDLSAPVKTYLRSKGAVRVALVTPYGATKTDYFAVSIDRKLDGRQKPIPGNVGHDRIQQGRRLRVLGKQLDCGTAWQRAILRGLTLILTYGMTLST